MLSDNQGNVYSLLNQRTKKIDPAPMLMEMLLQLHQAGLQPTPSRMKWQINTWADELTHPDFNGYDCCRELSVNSVLPDFNTVLYGPSKLI